MDEIFEKASRAWNAMDKFRSDRSRCKRFVYGDQFGDPVEYDGRRMTERRYIEEMGQTPMKNNILRRILRNVVGVYRSSYKVPVATKFDYSGSGIVIKDINRNRKNTFSENYLDELLPRQLEEFLISGLAVVKVAYRKISGAGEPGIGIFPVTPDNFFFHSDGYDPRGWDVDMVGEVHNVSYANLIASFCRNAEDFRKLESVYAGHSESGSPCRVMEVWYRATDMWCMVHDENSASVRKMPLWQFHERLKMNGPGKSPGIDLNRVKTDLRTCWRCAWYSQDGILLKKINVSHDMHPYVWKAYPFLDGEVHSYISDIIDQQKYVNHLITLYDFIMKSSAKGVLLFPDESLPRGMSLQDVADEWSRFNGVIPYRAQPGVALPTQVSGNAANIGISELLKIEMQMLEDISGVSPTLQGKLQTNVSSGTLFAQQNQAALTSLLDVVRSFEEFTSAIAKKIDTSYMDKGRRGL
ncbi:MAG: hypothetical protein NC095_00350 [Muribaculum sp.]|nr:hypothetical protein [Muribaculum sp.]